MKLIDFYSENLAEKDRGRLVINTVVEALFYVYAEINDLTLNNELSILIDETRFIVICLSNIQSI